MKSLMLCSPMLRPDRTRLPAALRDWLGAKLSGPPRARDPQHLTACIYTVGRLGDFVLALSAIRLLVEHFGAANCALVTSPAVAGLAAEEFPGAHIITLPTEGASLTRHILPAWFRHRSKFRRWHFTHRINLRHQRTLHHEVTYSWIRADRDLHCAPEFYPASAAHGFSTELLAHAQVVGSMLGRDLVPEEIAPRFKSLTPSDDHRLLVYPLSRDRLRCLAPEIVVAALRRWRERYQGSIVFGGSTAEADSLMPYLAAAQQAGLRDVSVEVKDGVAAFFAHVAKAGTILTTETAAAHVATALDKRAIILLGGGFHGLCFPWSRSSRQLIVQHQLPCFGCGWSCNQPEMYCLTRLPASLAAAPLHQLEA